MANAGMGAGLASNYLIPGDQARDLAQHEDRGRRSQSDTVTFSTAAS